MRKPSYLLVTLTLLALVFTGCTRSVQSHYPDQLVSIIVPWAANGGTDIGTRILMKYAKKHLHTDFIIQNVEGSGSEVGILRMVHSAPDGYTLAAFNSASIILTLLRPSAYDPLADIEPICLVVSDPRLIAIRANDTRFPTAEAFLQFIRDNPNKLTIGTSGAGTSGHFSILAMNRALNIQAKPIHFNSAGDTKAALMGGQIDAAAQTYGEVYSALKAGQTRVIAVATENRMPELPEVPIFKELGFDWVISSNRGFAAPKGTPPEIIQIIADGIKRVSEDPAYGKDMQDLGMPILYLGPEDYRALIKSEIDLFGPLAQELSTL